MSMPNWKFVIFAEQLVRTESLSNNNFRRIRFDPPSAF